ncbi:hypothetical protein GCM10009789_74710 [Kribbella sancticallisti]|uniref:Uncharacterized protein n=1 Tax=Kribbella sancticallisti TaxID=460087 RepID=A0ABN2EP69_9ACTN
MVTATCLSRAAEPKCYREFTSGEPGEVFLRDANSHHGSFAARQISQSEAAARKRRLTEWEC